MNYSKITSIAFPNHINNYRMGHGDYFIYSFKQSLLKSVICPVPFISMIETINIDVMKYKFPKLFAGE